MRRREERERDGVSYRFEEIDLRWSHLDGMVYCTSSFEYWEGAAHARKNTTAFNARVLSGAGW